MRRAQSEGRGTGGVGPLDTIKADAAIVKDKAAGVVDNVREAVAGGGNKGAPTPKTRNDGDKPLRQPAPKDGEHKPKSSSAGGAGGNPASGMSESANPMAGDHGSECACVLDLAAVCPLTPFAQLAVRRRRRRQGQG
jgi:hypothetical protein